MPEARVRGLFANGCLLSVTIFIFLQEQPRGFCLHGSICWLLSTQAYRNILSPPLTASWSLTIYFSLSANVYCFSSHMYPLHTRKLMNALIETQSLSVSELQLPKTGYYVKDPALQCSIFDRSAHNIQWHFSALFLALLDERHDVNQRNAFALLLFKF